MSQEQDTPNTRHRVAPLSSEGRAVLLAWTMGDVTLEEVSTFLRLDATMLHSARAIVRGIGQDLVRNWQRDHQQVQQEEQEHGTTT